MDGLGIVVLLKEILEKMKDLIQMLTRKRNSFNEKVDDFLIFRIFSTIKKKRNLRQNQRLQDEKKLNKFITKLSRNIPAPKSRRI